MACGDRRDDREATIPRQQAQQGPVTNTWAPAPPILECAPPSGHEWDRMAIPGAPAFLVIRMSDRGVELSIHLERCVRCGLVRLRT